MTRTQFWTTSGRRERLDPEAHGESVDEPARQVAGQGDSRLRLLVGRGPRRGVLLEPVGAAYIINGGCSDDGFEYFRRWLVLQGATSSARR